MKSVLLAGKLLFRDLKAGEIWLFFIAMLIAISAISSINLFTDRVQRAIKLQTATLLGGNLVLNSNQPIDINILNQADDFGLQKTITIDVLTMVRKADKQELCFLKAVESNYPLLGQLVVQKNGEKIISHSPNNGSVWLQPRLLNLLNAKIGDTVTIGSQQFSINGTLFAEPERPTNWFSIAPRLVINLDDLKSTQIIAPGSRATYQLLLTGNSLQLKQFNRWVTPKLKAGQRILNATTDRPGLSRVIDRTNYYMNITSILSVMLAAIVIAMASQQYCARHIRTVAILRYAGANTQQIITLYSLIFLLLSLFSICISIALGAALQNVLENIFYGLFHLTLPPTHFMAAWPAVLIGLMLVFGLALPQIIRLKSVTAIGLLQQQIANARSNRWPFVLAFFTIVLILAWQVNDLFLLMILLGGISASVAIFLLLGNSLITAITKLKLPVTSAWRLGLQQLSRNRQLTTLNIIVIGMTLFVIILLSLIQYQLLSHWQQELPTNTPNYFAINIPADKADNINHFFEKNNISHEPLYPLIRGRLVKRNNQPIMQTLNEEQQKTRALFRDLNFTYRAAIPSDNEIVAGRWWSKDTNDAFVSVEQGVAERLGLQLGDTIGVNIYGEEVHAKIINFRTVTWTSFKPNFFMIFTPAVLKKFPSSYMTSFYLSQDQNELVNQLTTNFPNITIIDVADIVKNIQLMVENMSSAVNYLLLFIVLGSLLVLITTIAINQKQRRHSIAILRALGLTNRDTHQIIISEYTVLGIITGIAAAITATLSYLLIITNVFHMAFIVVLWPIFLVPIMTAITLVIVGYIGSYNALHTSPQYLLRTFD